MKSLAILLILSGLELFVINKAPIGKELTNKTDNEVKQRSVSSSDDLSEKKTYFIPKNKKSKTDSNIVKNEKDSKSKKAISGNKTKKINKMSDKLVVENEGSINHEKMDEISEISSFFNNKKIDKKLINKVNSVFVGNFVSSLKKDQIVEEKKVNKVNSTKVVDSLKEDVAEETTGIDEEVEEIVTSVVEAESEVVEIMDELKWSVYDDTPEGASISFVFDEEKGKDVVLSSGDGTQNGYRYSDNGNSMGETNLFKMSWDMNFSESFVIYIRIVTTLGERYLTYTSKDVSYSLLSGTYLNFGIGKDVNNGQWKTIFRDLSADVKALEPENEITEIKYFMFRGNGKFSDVKYYYEENVSALFLKEGSGLGIIKSDDDTINCGETCSGIYKSGVFVLEAVADSSSKFVGWSGDCEGSDLTCILNLDKDTVVSAIFDFNGTYDNGEDGLTLGWSVYDNSPLGSIISNVYDEEKESFVIKFEGSGTGNGYRLRKNDNSKWKNSEDTIISWDMKYDESYVIYIDVETDLGHKYIYYTNSNSDNLGDGGYIHHGLGSSSNEGSWITIERNLLDDLHDSFPEATILEVNGMLIRGSGYLDNIKME